MSTKIEWTNKTWNPIIGCTKVSTGCDNCYAERMANRLSNIDKTNYYISVLNPLSNPMTWNGECAIIFNQILKPFKWKKPRMIFVCSMGDLFHESVHFEWILQVWDVMCSNPSHTYQLLTKRPERVIEFLKWLGNKAKDDGLDSIPSQSENPMDYISIPDFIWIGVTAENQEQADKRIPILLQIPAKLRFISCEPLLSDINLELGLSPYKSWLVDSIDWVIAGPETGQKARPMQKEWIENIYKQCKAVNVPFFDKKDTLGLNVKQFPKT